jgi:hypothetical protein
MGGNVAIAKIAVASTFVHTGGKGIIANSAGEKASAPMEPNEKFASLDAEAQESAYMESKSTFAKNATVDTSAFMRLKKDFASLDAEAHPYVSMVSQNTTASNAMVQVFALMEDPVLSAQNPAVGAVVAAFMVGFEACVQIATILYVQ